MRRRSLVGIVSVSCIFLVAGGVLIWLAAGRSPGSGQVLDSTAADFASPDNRALVATAQTKDDEILTGTYSCTGKNPGGEEYSGIVSIRKKDETYHLLWSIGRAQNHRGFGIREGNVLSVCFSNGESMGIVAYRIEQDGQRVRLIGRWTTLGWGKTQAETLVKRTRSEEVSDSV